MSLLKKAYNNKFIESITYSLLVILFNELLSGISRKWMKYTLLFLIMFTVILTCEYIRMKLENILKSPKMSDDQKRSIFLAWRDDFSSMLVLDVSNITKEHINGFSKSTSTLIHILIDGSEKNTFVLNFGKNEFETVVRKLEAYGAINIEDIGEIKSLISLIEIVNTRLL